MDPVGYCMSKKSCQNNTIKIYERFLGSNKVANCDVKNPKLDGNLEIGTPV